MGIYILKFMVFACLLLIPASEDYYFDEHH